VHDDACAKPDPYAGVGWQATGVYFRVNFLTHEHVLYPSACNDPQYRPSSIVITCGDGNFYVDSIHWRSWTDGRAYGVGVGHGNDCTPDCADGHFHAYSGVVVRLDRMSYCSAHGDYEFTHLRYRFTNDKPYGPRSVDGLLGCAPT
jgi:hypothetical protein